MLDVTRTLSIAALSLGSLLLAAAAASSATEPAPAVRSAGGQYIGAAKCKVCHSKEDVGDQMSKWEASRHAHAFDVLASDRAKAVAAERGVEDPQKSEQCLRCHVTGFGEPEDHFKKGFDRALGVQCETCHGPGDKHMLARIKGAQAKTEGYPEIGPDETIASPPVETCTKCHNPESPTYKPFCNHLRRAQIRHLDPKKPRTPEELAALDACTCEGTCVCKTEGPCK